MDFHNFEPVKFLDISVIYNIALVMIIVVVMLYFLYLVLISLFFLNLLILFLQITNELTYRFSLHCLMRHFFNAEFDVINRYAITNNSNKKSMHGLSQVAGAE